MMQVWKFPIAPGQTDIAMPKGAKPLHVDKQRNDTEIWLWASVDPAAEVEERHFIAIGTGHSVPFGYITYIGTVLLHDDNIVVHVFEVH